MPLSANEIKDRALAFSCAHSRENSEPAGTRRIALFGDARDLSLGVGEFNILCNVDQFYGIEIEEFPAQIAQTALWLMVTPDLIRPAATAAQVVTKTSPLWAVRAIQSAPESFFKRDILARPRVQLD